MENFILSLCDWENKLSTGDVVQITLAIIALVVTIRIPIKIMKFQRYQNLFSIYMSFEFSNAIQSVIHFFHDDCNCDVERIPSEYKKRFEQEVKLVEQGECSKNKDFGEILHYQRRYLHNFFLELEMCRESSRSLDKRIRKDWTSTEAWIVKILIYMDKAVEEDPDMFKDISCIKYDAMPTTKGLGEYLEKFYNAMKEAPDSMRL